MQTFLSSSDFPEAAYAIPSKQLGKQRSEALAILRALKGFNKGYRWHPATLMWEGCEVALFWYLQCVVAEWKSRGYEDDGTVEKAIECFLTGTRTQRSLTSDFTLRLPWWLGYARMHEAYADLLLWKAGRLKGSKPRYIWPVNADRWELREGVLWLRKKNWRRGPEVKTIHDTGSFLITSQFKLGANQAIYMLERKENKA